ncbi:acetyl-CoA carboxylase carboxyltransferase subunit alpha [Ligilactobacillus agilis]|uniref:acetyl-CoA carboxylase carboxyltransferase subunit alpha n=1 Tax=Ligilactobacillus agilis TaxID=1601 RepID=UPI0014375419|nr:carboxyltransferase subunit alpha [Ligilactobacillus agilis]GET19601.1 acetyl-CoA carboxylase, carboxyl transferase subunit alpha [Ligilactobacillus agilis]
MVSLFERKQKVAKSAAEVVKAARSEDKITAPELIKGVFDDFFELHGDRTGADDPAIIGGIGYLGNQAVTVIAIDKGKTPEERIAKHFGGPTPNGYRKALRLMKQAEKFKRPVITLINTAGAYPGRTAEEGGQGQAIAQNLLAMSDLKVPIIAVIFGEGGSGGALALALADKVYMLENSMYTVLSPEGFASILWKDSRRADEAAEVMQVTPKSLLKQGVIEGIIEEPSSHKKVIKNVARVLTTQLEPLLALTPRELIARRQARFRKF